MSFYKVSALSVLAISLAACSSSGGGSNHTSSPTHIPNNNQSITIQPTNQDINQAKKGKVQTVKGYDIAREINGKIYRSGESAIDSSNYPLGISEREFNETSVIDGKNVTIKGKERVYNQKYSIVYGYGYKDAFIDYKPILEDVYGYKMFSIGDVAGLATQESGIPKEGVAAYQGKLVGFSDSYNRITGQRNDGNDTGDFSYTVNFSDRTGQGAVTGMSWVQDFRLDKGSISKVNLYGRDYIGIKSTASLNDRMYDEPRRSTVGEYTLAFYGPNAEEIAGVVKMAGNNGSLGSGSVTGAYSNQEGFTEFGFGGTRGAITK